MKNLKSLIFVVVLLVLTTVTATSFAQCSMCRAVAESGTKDNVKKTGRGLNNGILYLLSTPYLLGGVAFFIWRKNRKKNTPAV